MPIIIAHLLPILYTEYGAGQSGAIHVAPTHNV